MSRTITDDTTSAWQNRTEQNQSGSWMIMWAGFVDVPGGDLKSAGKPETPGSPNQGALEENDLHQHMLLALG